MLDSLHGELLAVALAHRSPDTPAANTPDCLEGRFVTVHDSAPLLLAPVEVLPGKVESFQLHCFSQKRLLGGPPGWEQKGLAQMVPDPAKADISKQRRGPLDLPGRVKGVHPDDLLHLLQDSQGELNPASTPFLPLVS